MTVWNHVFERQDMNNIEHISKWKLELVLSFLLNHIFSSTSSMWWACEHAIHSPIIAMVAWWILIKRKLHHPPQLTCLPRRRISSPLPWREPVNGLFFPYAFSFLLTFALLGLSWRAHNGKDCPHMTRWSRVGVAESASVPAAVRLHVYNP